jgi:hypothetical protein
MSKRPSKAKPVESHGLLVLRNRLVISVGVMAVAGVLLWKPWASSIPHAGRAVASLVPVVAEPTTPPVPPQKIATTSAPATAPAAQPSPAFTTASVAPASVPLPPTPPAAPRMPASLQADFDSWLIEAYRACWTPPGATPDGDPYYPRVRVALKSDGTLAGAPKLVNPPGDPAWKPHAEAALKAVKSCDPLKVPDKFAPYYTQWKTKTVFFDPTRS